MCVIVYESVCIFGEWILSQQIYLNTNRCVSNTVHGSCSSKLVMFEVEEISSNTKARAVCILGNKQGKKLPSCLLKDTDKLCFPFHTIPKRHGHCRSEFVCVLYTHAHLSLYLNKLHLILAKLAGVDSVQLLYSNN